MRKVEAIKTILLNHKVPWDYIAVALEIRELFEKESQEWVKEGRRELLEELMAKAVYRNYIGLQTGSDPAELTVSVPNVKGWLVFIPEEQK